MKDTLSKIEKWQVDLENRFHKIEINLQKLKTGLATDNVHDFRVEIKKLKALLRLCKSIAKVPSTCRLDKKLNKSFRYLGRLREWQIQLQKITEACTEKKDIQPVLYLDQINREIEWYRLKAGRTLLKLSSLEKNKKRIEKHFSEIPGTEAIQHFIDLKMLALNDLFQQEKQDDESMHFMRKQLKDVQYIISYGQKKRNENGRYPRLKSIQAATGKLGDFHDLRVALFLLDEELKSLHQAKEEKKMLREIRKQWQYQKEILRQEAWAECRNLLYPNPA
jgi:CHAD domain-containing protein